MSELEEIAVKIGLAALLAGIVGAEREWTGQWAGLRTHMLIAVGATLLTHISTTFGSIYHGGSNAWDPSRMASATARFSSTTGDGTMPNNTSYQPTMRPQSVPAASEDSE